MAESQDEVKAEMPEPTQEERIRDHMAGLTPEQVQFIRTKLLDTTHTFPSGERALTAALAELGLEKREPTK